MKNVILCLTAAALSLSAEPPFRQWDFEKWDANGMKSVSKSGSISAPAGAMQGKGYNGSTAACADAKNSVVWYTGNLFENSNAFTVELKFFLNEPVNRKNGNTLICYAKHSWNRGQFLLRLTPQNSLEASFRLMDAAAQKVLKKLTVSSGALKIEPGKYYTVRVASRSGGALKIWLDGQMVAVQEKDSFSLGDLKIKSPGGYPFLAVGWDLSNLPSDGSRFRPLNGFVDDLTIWKSFQEPEMKVETGKAQENVLFLKNNGRFLTGKFHVADRPGKLLGSFIRPGQNFLDAAAQTEIKLDQQNLVLVFRCPIAQGTKLNVKNTNLWNGDLVEFFFRPEMSSPEFFQYALNAGGKSAAIHWKAPGTQSSGFRSQAKFRTWSDETAWYAEMIIPVSELRLNQPAAGKTPQVNFTRTGTTGGGLSSWSKGALNDFRALDKFGILVIGDPAAVLNARLAALSEELSHCKNGGDSAKALADDLRKLSGMIAQNGSDMNRFSGYAAAIENLKPRLTLVQFGNTASMLWQPLQMWSNDLRVSALSKKLTEINLTLPQNSFTWHGFAFSNLSDKPFLGQLKYFSTERSKDNRVFQFFNENLWKYRYPQDPVRERLEFYEALPILSSAGNTVYDPFLPLGMKTLLRAGAGATVPLWLRFSSAGLKPGTYTGVICLKPSYPDFPVQTVPFTVKVLPVDLGTDYPDSTNYTFMYPNGHENLTGILARKKFNIIYPGCIGQLAADYYPEFDADGKMVKPADYSKLDRMIELSVSSGIPLNRIQINFWLELNLHGLRHNGVCTLKYNTPQWKNAFGIWLKDITEHCRKKYGIGKDRLLFTTVDEPSGDVNDPGSRMYQAYLQAKIIKDIDPELRTKTNPLPDVLNDFARNKVSCNKLLEVYDIIELYRPSVTPEIAAWAKNSGKIIWTYGIYGKTTAPDVYRREYWQSLRDGFSSVVTYWHLDAAAGGDGFNGNDGVQNRVDYGSMYVDYELGTALSGRREEAHELGREDYRLAKYCEKRLKQRNDPALQSEYRSIIQQGASGSMAEMDAAYARLLDLAIRLNR